MPEISIIMPVYNTQQYLNTSIHSLLKQSFTDFELLLVNDGSTDCSLLYCKSMEAIDSRIRVLDLPHRGVVAARVAGISAAQGSCVGFVDADDWVEQDYLSHLYHALVENNSDISMCRTVREYANATKNLSCHIHDGTYQGDTLEELKLERLFYNENSKKGFTTYYLWDKLFRKQLLLDNLKYMDSIFTRGEDTLLYTACFLDSRCLSIVDYFDYHYRIRKGSTVHISDAGYLNEVAPFRMMLKRMLAEKNYSAITYKVDKVTIFELAGISKGFLKDDLPPLDEELKIMIAAQQENDGDSNWAAAVRRVKEFYL